MKSNQDAVVEMFAQQLHREYRAAEKALRLDGGATHDGVCLFHDHGWAGCRKQAYFRKRAALLMKRSSAVNPETLGEAEQALAAHVLLRRFAVAGCQVTVDDLKGKPILGRRYRLEGRVALGERPTALRENQHVSRAADAELALAKFKAAKEPLSVELKTAREQLLTSAA